MKRRVLTTKSNKKALRQVLAANSGTCTGMKPPYNVLVDASFVRMAVSEPNSGVTAPLSAALKDRAFGEEARIFYHPATYNKVLRTCPEALDLLTDGASDVTRVKFPNWQVARQQQWEKRQKDAENGVEPADPAGRSELKALTEFITRQRAIDKRLWFVATVNHDMRAEVGAVTPTIRLAIRPTGMWIEPQTGAAAVVNDDEDEVDAADSTTNANASSSAIGVTTFKRGKRNRGGEDGDVSNNAIEAPLALKLAVSEKDAAFMRKLGLQPPTLAAAHTTVSTRAPKGKRGGRGRDQKPAPATAFSSKQKGSSVPQSSQHQSTAPKKKKSAPGGGTVDADAAKKSLLQGANPMASKKKKQKLRVVS